MAPDGSGWLWMAAVDLASRREVAGDLMEAGVWRGGAAILMAAVLEVELEAEELGAEASKHLGERVASAAAVPAAMYPGLDARQEVAVARGTRGGRPITASRFPNFALQPLLGVPRW